MRWSWRSRGGADGRRGKRGELAPSEELKALKKKAQQLSFIRPLDALAAGERALEIAESTLGPDHVEVASILATIARFHALKFRPADAEALERRAIAIMEKAHGPNSLELAQRRVQDAVAGSPAS